MGANTKIEWCDHSLSPWWGCTKVSPGCAHCYAEGLDARWHGGKHWGAGAPRFRQPNFERNALELDRKAAKRGHRVTVFPSMCDPFDDEVPAEWLADFLAVVRRTSHLTWIILTKRPGFFAERMEEVLDVDGDSIAWPWLRGTAPKNVWLLTSVEDQTRANQRIPQLRRIPAVVRGLSVEPMLSAIDLFTPEIIGRAVNETDARGPGEAWLDWVICGGESGPSARPMHPDWARDLRDQCAAGRVPFFFKQWGEWMARSQVLLTVNIAAAQELAKPHLTSAVMRRDASIDHSLGDASTSNDADSAIYRVGKQAAGRFLDGREHNNFPDLTK